MQVKLIIFGKINEKPEQGQPFLNLGINGTGKNISSKRAHMLQQKKYSVVEPTPADTFRAGAIEQLREHTNRLNLKLAQNCNSDPGKVSQNS